MDPIQMLLMEIIKHPEDDTVRLAYADAIEEAAQENPPRIKCPNRKCEDGRYWIGGDPRHDEENSYTCGSCGRRSGMYGHTTEDRKFGCKRPCRTCDTAGTIRDTSAADRAEFIREQIHNPVAEGTATEKYPERQRHLWARLHQVRSPGTIGSGIDHFSRGFLCNIRCSAGELRQRADEFIWFDGQLETCEGCHGIEVHGAAGHANYPQSECPCCESTGHVRRTCPLTAHPIRHVELTTDPEFFTHDHNGVWTDTLMTGHFGAEALSSGVVKSLLEMRYPGITFTLPRTRTPWRS